MSSVPTVAAAILPGKSASAGPELELAAEIHVLVMGGRWHEARERYGDLVAVHQRRASRLAYYYLRDAAEADEAVQDAFVKAFSHFASYDRTRPFEIWFTRILVNACLDRVKARKRRLRWQVGLGEHADDRFSADHGKPGHTSPEDALLQQERARAAPRRHSRAAQPAADGRRAEPSRWPDDPRSERGHRPQRIDGARAPVSRTPASPHADEPRARLTRSFLDERSAP